MSMLTAVVITWGFMRWGNPALQRSARMPALAKAVLRVAFGGGGPGAVEK